MKKTTDLLNELNTSNNIDKYLKDNHDSIIDQTLAEHFCRIFEERNISKADVIHKSNLNEIYAYQILGGKRMPSRDKIIALCVGASFSLDDTNYALKIGGFAPLYPKSERDSIIIYGIQRKRSIIEINEELFTHNHDTI